MQINKAALEIFDFTSSLAVYSEHELKVGDQAIPVSYTHLDVYKRQVILYPLLLQKM